MLPLATTLLNAAQHQPRRSFMTIRTEDEQMRTQTAAERTVSLMQCPCHARSHSHGRRARTTKHKQHDLDLAFRPEPCRWCLYSSSRSLARELAASTTHVPIGRTTATPTQWTFFNDGVAIRCFRMQIVRINPSTGIRFLVKFSSSRLPRLTLNAAVCSGIRSPRVMLGGGAKKGSRGGGWAQGRHIQAYPCTRVNLT